MGNNYCIWGNNNNDILKEIREIAEQSYNCKNKYNEKETEKREIEEKMKNMMDNKSFGSIQYANEYKQKNKNNILKIEYDDIEEFIREINNIPDNNRNTEMNNIINTTTKYIFSFNFWLSKIYMHQI